MRKYLWYFAILMVFSCRTLAQSVLYDVFYPTDEMPTGHIKTVFITGWGRVGPTTDSFDVNGRQLTRRQCPVYNGFSTCQPATYVYDVTGKLTRRNIYESDGTLSSRMEYAYSGNTVTLKEFRVYEQPAPTLEQTTTCIYNSKHQLVQKDELYSGDKKKYTTRYVYDAKGRKIKEFRNFTEKGDGTVQSSKSFFTYDDSDRIIKEDCPADGDQPAYAEFYSYPVSDARGNWLKREHFTEIMGKRTKAMVMEREIEYY